jgi:hypothetical protein
MPFKHAKLEPSKPSTFKVPMLCQYTKLPGTFLTEIKTGFVKDKEIIQAPERTVFIPVHEGVFAYKPRKQSKNHFAARPD